MYRLADYAKAEKNPIRKGFIYGLAREGLVSNILTWRNTGAMNETAVRFDAVPEPSYVPIDGDIAEQTVSGHQITHSVYMMALHMDFPAPLEDIVGDLVEGKPSAQQIMLALKGANYKLNDQFINGDQASGPNGFNGLRKLASNMAAAQTVKPNSQIDLSSYTSAAAQNFISLIMTAYHTVDGHKPTAVFANDTALLKYEEILRRENIKGVDYDWNAAKLNVNNPRVSQNDVATAPAFVDRGVPWYDIGVKADQTTRIIGNNYTHSTGGSETEIYMIKSGADQLEGIQAAPLNVIDLGLAHDKHTYRSRLVWIHGLALWGPRSIVKVEGVKL